MYGNRGMTAFQTRDPELIAFFHRKLAGFSPRLTLLIHSASPISYLRYRWKFYQMKNRDRSRDWLSVMKMISLVSLVLLSCYPKNADRSMQTNLAVQSRIYLPEPVYRSTTSVEEALLKRRSVRDYKKTPLSLKEIAQLLWAAQGITDPAEGGRTAPSAGALYPLEIYVLSRRIENLASGLYHYDPRDHSMELLLEGDRRTALGAAALMQAAVQRASAVLVMTAVYSRTTQKYGERGKRYVHMEAGHAAQNIYLQARSLEIGTVVIGAFVDSLVKKTLHLPKEEETLYLIPVGKV